MCQYRYRYHEDVTWYEERDPVAIISLISYKVTKITPQGAWIDNYGTKKFVLNGRGKRFAHETPFWAWESFVARKHKQHHHAKRALQSVELVLEKIKDPLADQPEKPFFFNF